MNEVEMNYIKDKIENMNKFNQIEILRIFNKFNITLNENKYGVHINLADLPKELNNELQSGEKNFYECNNFLLKSLKECITVLVYSDFFTNLIICCK